MEKKRNHHATRRSTDPTPNEYREFQETMAWKDFRDACDVWLSKNEIGYRATDFRRNRIQFGQGKAVL